MLKLFWKQWTCWTCFYLSLILGLTLDMLFGIPVMNNLYIICLIVIPLILMFFRVPLSLFIKYKSYLLANIMRVRKKKLLVLFLPRIFLNFFEFLLSFVTNTLSFLRVGGFVLSHAGMMLVVMTLTEMVSGGASIFIIIFGNIFVMALEGMIVAIQVMRLGYYEMFSRFYEGNGKPFKPIGCDLN